MDKRTRKNRKQSGCSSKVFESPHNTRKKKEIDLIGIIRSINSIVNPPKTVDGKPVLLVGHHNVGKNGCFLAAIVEKMVKMKNMPFFGIVDPPSSKCLSRLAASFTFSRLDAYCKVKPDYMKIVEERESYGLTQIISRKSYEIEKFDIPVSEYTNCSRDSHVMLGECLGISLIWIKAGYGIPARKGNEKYGLGYACVYKPNSITYLPVSHRKPGKIHLIRNEDYAGGLEFLLRKLRAKARYLILSGDLNAHWGTWAPENKEIKITTRDKTNGDLFSKIIEKFELKPGFEIEPTHWTRAEVSKIPGLLEAMSKLEKLDAGHQDDDSEDSEDGDGDHGETHDVREIETIAFNARCLDGIFVSKNIKVVCKGFSFLPSGMNPINIPDHTLCSTFITLDQ